ncbi:polyamine transporter 1 [Coprinopsis sp. MPI-PUGE-AT-0042]|nr:polyamine transporter 1 [Coprinopsis sp. MPI-PUGE-AT-0042]
MASRACQDAIESASQCASTTTTTVFQQGDLEEKRVFDPYLAVFDEGDSANPRNWSNGRKWHLTMACASGIFSNMTAEFGIESEKVGILTLSLFVAGYCVGPILWGPLSDHIYPFIGFTCFQIGTALAPNTASLLIFRFLGGTFAAAPLTITGALLSDIWDADARGKAMAIFTIAPFAGPALGPIVAGFMGDNTSWRNLFWVLTGFCAFCWLLIMFTVPETYAPVILARKAQTKRQETGDSRYYAEFERRTWDVRKRAYHVLVRPWVIFFTEPMIIALTLYMSFVYGCLYLLFAAFPIVFGKSRGFSAGVSGLMFLPLPIGGAIAVILYVCVYNPRYEKEVKRFAPRPVPPEARLAVTLFGGPLFALSFFWFGWTSFPSISYWAPMLSGLLIGFSMQLIFLGLFNYMVDAYLPVAASALASTTVVRSLFGAAFPLFGADMYNKLDPRWASTLLGGIAILLVPVPFILTSASCQSSSVCRNPTPDTMPPMTFNGVVTKAGFMNKTVTVTVSRFINHKLTGKRIVRSKKYLVHDEENKLRTEDLVVIRNCPPISARKRFTVHQLVESPETEREIARAKRVEQQANESSSTTTSSPILDAVKKAVPAFA